MKKVLIYLSLCFVVGGVLGIVNRGKTITTEPTQGQIHEQERHQLYDYFYHEDGQRRDLREIQ